MKTYTGGCHCQKVCYEVAIDNFDGAITCNCSMCSKQGWILTFVPTSSFKLLSGEDNLTTYHFNEHVIDHLFCKTCGLESFGRGQDENGNKMISINVLCLDEVDTEAIKPSKYNGKGV